MKEHLAKDMGREPTHVELAGATNMSAFQVRRCLEVGRAARNKLIKVSINGVGIICFECQLEPSLYNM